MPGELGTQNKRPQDILFDLTPDDDKAVKESDLLSLVNYGQLQKPMKVAGTDGRVYEVEFALLWDEDYTDLLRKTTQYANDMMLRVKIMKRLKIFKSIQRIDKQDFSNMEDPAQQRLLWTLICRMSDAQMDFLCGLYDRLELERNMSITEALTKLNQVLDKTSPDKKAADKTQPAGQPTEHEALFRQHGEAQTKTEEAVKETIKEKSGIVDNASKQPVKSKPVEKDAK